MKAKVIVKWGLVAIVASAAVTALMVYQTEKISKHEYQWQRDHGKDARFSQDVPYAKEKRP